MLLPDAAALLFDMDGTLIDSTEASETTWSRWAAAHDVSIERIRQVHHGRLPAETIAIVAPHLDAVTEGRAIYAEQESTTAGIRPIAGAKAFLESVPTGRAAIVTAATLRILQFRLRAVGMTPPRVCITADSIATGKPDPAGYLDAARRLGFGPHQCVVFEDAPAGLLAAHRAGMRAVAVLSNYTESALRRELGASAMPAACIPDFSEVTLRGHGINLPD